MKIGKNESKGDEINPRIREAIGFRAGVIVALLAGILANMFVWKFQSIVMDNMVYVSLSVLLIILIWKTMINYEKILEVHMRGDEEKKGEEKKGEEIYITIHRFLDNADKEKRLYLALRDSKESCLLKIIIYPINYLFYTWVILLIPFCTIALAFKGVFVLIAIIWFLAPLLLHFRKKYYSLIISLAQKFSLDIVYYPDVGFPLFLDVRDYELVFDLKNQRYYFRYVEKDKKIEDRCLKMLK